jgi:hypothetical protein
MGMPAVTADADRLIDRQPPEKRHGKSGRQLLAAAVAEDVAFVMAVRHA